MIPKRYTTSSFGGDLLKSHPKEKRPFSPSLALHVVFKSSQVEGGLIFSKNKKVLQSLIEDQARDHLVRVYAWQTRGSYFHIVIQTKSRKRYLAFIRSISGLIARKLLGAERGKPSKKRFWAYRPFSRIIDWNKRAFYHRDNLEKYILEDYSKKQTSYILEINRLWLSLVKRKE